MSESVNKTEDDAVEMTKGQATQVVKSAIKRIEGVSPSTHTELHCGRHLLTIVDDSRPELAEILGVLSGVVRVSSHTYSTFVYWHIP